MKTIIKNISPHLIPKHDLRTYAGECAEVGAAIKGELNEL